jgi:type I restriction enzyme M protein
MVHAATQQLPLEEAIPARAFERRLDELHEMLYRRGGIRPVNAAIEELSKVVLLQLQNSREPEWVVAGHGPISEVLDPQRVRDEDDLRGPKAAFRQLLALPEFEGRLPDDGLQPIWPLDEPLRIDRADVLAEALDVVPPSMVDASSLSGFDILGTAFDVFLRGRYDHSGGLATYLTPHNVAAMLAQLALAETDLLAEDISGPVVGDPCCGTGRFLVAAVHEVLRTGTLDRDRSARIEALLDHGLFGADQSASSVAKARINLLLYGVDRPFVFRVQDSITDSHVDALRGTLRVILTNPPFGEGKYDDPEGVARTQDALPSMRKRARIDPALAFLARCLDLLRDGGRVGIVLPDGLVDSKTLKDALLRHGTTRLSDVYVEANVSLPTATFALSGTVAKTSTVLMRKGGASRSSVFLARAEHVGYLKQAGAAVPDPHGDELPLIGDSISRALRQPGPLATSKEPVAFVTTAPLAARVLAEDLQTLDPSRLDPNAFAAREELRTTGGCQLRRLLDPVRRKVARADGETPFVSVLHIDDLGVVAWHKARGYTPTTPGQRARAGEILFSLLNPRQMRAAVVPDQFTEVLCSAEFGIFRASVDPYRVLALLHDPRVKAQLAPLGRGTSSSRRRIDEDDLLEVYVASVPDDVLAKAAVELRQNMAALCAATTSISAALHGVTDCS